MDSLIKQPNESFFIAVDFSRVLDSAETIVESDSSTSVIKLSDGTDVTSDIIESGTLGVYGDNGQKLKVRIRGGVNFEKYKITLIAKTSNGNEFEKDIELVVVDF